MISWATVRDDGAAVVSLEDRQTEEAALHQYRSRYEEALGLAYSGDITSSKSMLEQVLSSMDTSRFKDSHIQFLALCNLSRVCEKGNNMDDAYASILRAVELNPTDVNAVSRAAWVASKLGDTWTARALLNSDVFREHGLPSLAEAILDNCSNDSPSTAPLLSNLQTEGRFILKIDPNDEDLGVFFEQLSRPECWQSEEVLIRRVVHTVGPPERDTSSPPEESMDMCDTNVREEAGNETDCVPAEMGSAGEIPDPAAGVATSPDTSRVKESSVRKRKSTRLVESAAGGAKPVGVVANMEVLISKLASDSSPGSQANSVFSSNVLFRNLMNEISPSPREVNVCQDQPISADTDPASRHPLSIDRSQFPAVGNLLKKLCHENERVLHRSKLALDLLRALASDAKDLIRLRPGMSDESPGAGIDTSVRYGVVKDIVLLAWPIILFEVCRDCGTFGLAQFLKELPEVTAVFLGECLMDAALQLALSKENEPADPTLNFLIWRWESVLKHTGVSETDPLIVLELRRDWVYLQYRMAALCRERKPGEPLNSVDHAPASLRLHVVQNMCVLRLPYLSEIMGVIKESTVSGIGKLPPAELLLVELSNLDANISCDINDDNRIIDTIKSRIARAVVIFESIHDVLSFHASLKDCLLHNTGDNAEVALFLRYLELCKPVDHRKEFVWEWFGAVDSVVSILYEEVRSSCANWSNVEESTPDHVINSFGSLVTWLLPLLVRLDCSNFIDTTESLVSPGKKVAEDTFFSVFRRVSYVTLLLTRVCLTTADHGLSSLCKKCVILLRTLSQLCSVTYNTDAAKHCTEVTAGLCMYFWKLYSDARVVNPKTHQKNLQQEFTGLLASSISVPSEISPVKSFNFFLRLSSWLFRGEGKGSGDEVVVGFLLKLLVDNYNHFMGQKRSAKGDVSNILSVVDSGLHSCAMMMIEIVYGVLIARTGDDRDVIMDAVVDSLCACIQEESSQQLFFVDGGRFHESIARRILPIVYQSEVCKELIGADILNAATKLEVVSYVDWAVAVDLQIDEDDVGTLKAVCECFALVCFDLYKIPILVSSNVAMSENPNSSTAGNLSGRPDSLCITIPEPLVPGIYIFMLLWDDCFVSLSRVTWNACLSILYRAQPLSNPPSTPRSAALCEYLFKLDDITGNMTNCFPADEEVQRRAQYTCNLVGSMPSHVSKPNAPEADPLIVLYTWVRSEFYSKLILNGGVGNCYTNAPGRVDRARPDSAGCSRPKRSSEVSTLPTQVVDYYFSFLCDVEQRVCPSACLAFLCVCHSDCIDNHLDFWFKIANCLYDLANAALDEMTSYCFPTNIAADAYLSVKHFDEKDESGCSLENILKGMFSMVPFGGYSSILEMILSASAPPDDLPHELDGVSPHDFQRMEEALLWKEQPVPCPGFSYVEAVRFLSRFHKSVLFLFDRVYTFMFAMYFRKHIVAETEVRTPEQVNDLVKSIVEDGARLPTAEILSYGVSPGAERTNDEVFTIDLDSNGTTRLAAAKVAIPLTEMKCILESNRVALLRREHHNTCFRRSLKHSLQGLALCRHYSMPNMFLPTFACNLLFKLKYSVQAVHYLMYQADEASRSLGVDKKIRVQVMFNYHNIRLQTCWKWLKDCYASGLDEVDSFHGVAPSPGKLPRKKQNVLMEELSILDGYKISSLAVAGPGTAAVNAVYLPSPIQLTGEIKSMFASAMGERVDSNSNLSSLSANSTPASSVTDPDNCEVSCEHLMSRLWIIALESVSGFKNCRKLDNFDCKAVHGLSSFISELITSRNVTVPSIVMESLKTAGISLTHDSVADTAWKMFEKRRPTMIVALWREEKRTTNRFDQVNQRQYYFDSLRAKYVECFLRAAARSGSTHYKRVYELTMTSLTVSELSPVMISVMRSCVNSFTNILKFRISDSAFCCPVTNNDSVSADSKAPLLHEACNVYELVCVKASCLMLPSEYVDGLLVVLVNAIRTSTIDYATLRCGEQQPGQILSHQENDMNSILEEWLMSEGRVMGEYNKKSSTKRARANRQSSGVDRTVSSVRPNAATREAANGDINEKHLMQEQSMVQCSPEDVCAPTGADDTAGEPDGKRRRLESGNITGMNGQEAKGFQRQDMECYPTDATESGKCTSEGATNSSPAPMSAEYRDVATEATDMQQSAGLLSAAIESATCVDTMVVEPDGKRHRVQSGDTTGENGQEATEGQLGNVSSDSGVVLSSEVSCFKVLPGDEKQPTSKKIRSHNVDAMGDRGHEVIEIVDSA